LDHLEGKAVWAYADDELLGPYTVENGSITIEQASLNVTVGLGPRVEGALQKLREKLTNSRPFRPPARIYELELSLADTGHLEISVNGGAFREVPLTFMDIGVVAADKL